MVERTALPASPPPPPAQPAPAPTPVDVSVSRAPGGRTTQVVASPSPAAPPVEGAPPADGRPTWLPEKFQSPEDMARAYGELERRLGQIAPVAPRVEVPGAPAPNATQPAAADLVAKLTQEYAQTGTIGPQSRQEFVQRTGLPDQFIDQQLSYLKAQERRTVEMAVQRLGGETAVKELTDWAAKRLSVDERAAFNRAVYSEDHEMAKLALDGLAAKYESEVGRSPRIMAGRKPQDQYGGITPYQSHAEWSAARKDPRYKVDPAYRQEVEDRLRISSRLGLL